MKLTPQQEDYYAQMRYYAEVKRQDEIARIFYNSPDAKNERHQAAHTRADDNLEMRAACAKCRAAYDAGYFVPDSVIAVIEAAANSVPKDSEGEGVADDGRV